MQLYDASEEKTRVQQTAVPARKTGINWVTSISLVLFHIGTVAALYYWSWSGFAAAVFLNWVAGSLGIGMGYHRLLTHRGYKTPKAVEYFLTVCGALALEGGPINWVATHRIHHAHSDRDGDPHTPRDGSWWAHVGWLLRGTALQYDSKVLARYAPELVQDPFHVLLNRFYFMPLVISGLILLAAGGFQIVLWGVFLRVTFGLHATWLVNSATHMWGKRRFPTRDDSRNNWWVALLTFGEGWHNNHHAHPAAARHGLAWYEIDMNWMGIRVLQMLGLATSVKLVNVHTLPGAASASADEKVRSAA